jgi:hypothetical protein
MKFAFQAGDRINMTVRVLFFPYTYRSLFPIMEMARVTLGIKAGGLSRVRGLHHKADGVPKAQLLETLPATRIRLFELRTSVQEVVVS